MTRLSDRDIERLLTDRPSVEPPSGLARRIKDEIPADLGFDLPLGETTAVERPWRRGLLLAATIVVAIGAVLFHQRHRDVLAPGSSAPEALPVVAAPAADVEGPGASPSAEARPVTPPAAEAARGEAVEEPDTATRAEPAPPPAIVARSLAAAEPPEAREETALDPLDEGLVFADAVADVGPGSAAAEAEPPPAAPQAAVAEAERPAAATASGLAGSRRSEASPEAKIRPESAAPRLEANRQRSFEDAVAGSSTPGPSTERLTGSATPWEEIRAQVEAGRWPPPEAARAVDLLGVFATVEGRPGELTVLGAPTATAEWDGPYLLRVAAAGPGARVVWNADVVSRHRPTGNVDRRGSDGLPGQVPSAAASVFEFWTRRPLADRDRLATVHLGADAGGQRNVTAADIAPDWDSAHRSVRLAGVLVELASVLRGPADRDAVAALADRARRLADSDYPADPRVAELARLVRRLARMSAGGPP